MTDIDPKKLQNLIDRQEILDCLTRYARGVDRLDRDLVLSAYHPDARDDHIAFVGSPEEFAFLFFDYHTQTHISTSHTLANHTCEINGDEAHAETYATFVGNNRDGTVDLIGVRYNDRLEKRDGEWKIADRVTVTSWHGQLKGQDEITEQLKKDMAYEPGGHVSRDRQDISYQRPIRVSRARRIPDVAL